MLSSNFIRVFSVNILIVFFLASCSEGDQPTKETEVIATVETFAGSTSGFENGPASSAKFNEPFQLAIMPSGDIFLVDQKNKAIRKIDITGNVTTIIEPQGTLEFTSIAASKSGQAYVSTMNKIFQITDGTLKELADGNLGFEDTYFASIESLAVHPDGSIYFTEGANYKIMRLSLDGVVSKFAGGKQGYKDGPLSEAEFNGRNNLYISNDGILYISDKRNHKIRKISGGIVSTIAGTTFGYGDGPIETAKFSFPSSLIKLQDESLVIVDDGNNSIRRIELEKSVSTLAGDFRTSGFADGVGTSAKFTSPQSIVQGSGGVMYVCDQMNHRIRKMTIK